MNNDLRNEFEFYEKHRNRLAKKYRGRYIVIVKNEVVGDYPTQEEAITETVKTRPLGTFLVHLVGSDEENDTQIFHSRIAHADPAR